MIARLLYGIGGLIEALIGLRFLFKLLGANPDNGFVSWIYSWSAPFVNPFAGIFGQDTTTTGTGTVTTGVFEWTSLIALVVIGLIVAVLGSLLVRRRVVA